MVIAFCLIIGVIGIFYGLSLHKSRNKVLAWPQTTGKIVHRDLLRSRRKGGGYTYTASVKYTYRVGGQEYLGERIYPLGAGSGGQKGQQAFLDKIPNDVLVHYDPLNPMEACLFPHSYFHIFLSYGVGALLFLGGVVWLIVKFYK